MKKLQLTATEQAQLVAFMSALTSPQKPFELPMLQATRELPRVAGEAALTAAEKLAAVK